MEGDFDSRNVGTMSISFQSTPSAWRETIVVLRIGLRTNISIHSLRMEGDAIVFGAFKLRCISIHSLRMEGDAVKNEVDKNRTISIHSLRMEGD